MIKVKNISLNVQTMKADVSLFSDTQEEVSSTPVTDIVGFPKGYEIEFGSSVMTASGEMAFMKSTGDWKWV